MEKFFLCDVILLPFISLCKEEGNLSENSHSRHMQTRESKKHRGVSSFRYQPATTSREPCNRLVPTAAWSTCCLYSVAWRLQSPFPTPLHCWIPAGGMEIAWCTCIHLQRGTASISKSMLMATLMVFLIKPYTVSSLLRTLGLYGNRGGRTRLLFSCYL